MKREPGFTIPALVLSNVVVVEYKSRRCCALHTISFGFAPCFLYPAPCFYIYLNLRMLRLGVFSNSSSRRRKVVILL